MVPGLLVHRPLQFIKHQLVGCEIITKEIYIYMLYNCKQTEKWEGNRLCFECLFLFLIGYKWKPLWQHCTILCGLFFPVRLQGLWLFKRERIEQLKYRTLKEITVGNSLALFFLGCNLFMLNFSAIPKSWYWYVSPFVMKKVEYVSCLRVTAILDFCSSCHAVEGTYLTPKNEFSVSDKVPW